MRKRSLSLALYSLLFFLLLCMPFTLTAQELIRVHDYTINSEELKGIKKVMHYTGNREDSTENRTMYYLSPEGKVAKTEMYSLDNLIHKSVLIYDAEGEIIREKVWSGIYTHDSEHPVISKDFYYLKKFFYDNKGRLTDISQDMAAGGKENRKLGIEYKYDDQGRRVEKKMTNYLGNGMHFKANSTEIIGEYDPGIEVTLVRYTYKTDTVIESIYDEDGNKLNYTLALLNEEGEPKVLTEYDAEGNPYYTSYYYYNNEGRLIDIRQEEINMANYHSDYFLNEATEMTFNERGLPVKATSQNYGSEYATYLVYYYK